MATKKGNRRVKRLATLTPTQDKRYGQLFEIAMGMGCGQSRADREAWRGICEEWPTLNRYDGAKA